MNLIPEIYDEKINLDGKMDLENKRRLEVPVFFLKFMEDKFKFKKIVKKNCEQTIISILKYSGITSLIVDEDKRIELVKEFLGLKNEKLRREIFDHYLTLLKGMMLLKKLFQCLSIDYSMMTI